MLNVAKLVWNDTNDDTKAKVSSENLFSHMHSVSNE